MRLKWEEWYELAASYYNEYHNLDIKGTFKTFDGVNYNPKGYKLGRWIERQRQVYKGNRAGLISKDRIIALNSIGMTWGYDSITWDDSFNILKEYYEKHGNIDITFSYVTESGYKLGEWLRHQRCYYMEGKLTLEQIQKLETLNIKWALREILSWEESYNIAKKYYEENGNLNVKDGYKTKDGYGLGRWVNYQREQKKANKLTEEQITKLEAIGLVWESNLTWNDSYKLLKMYYNEFNNISIPEIDVYHNYNLGLWLKEQKRSYFNNELTEEQIMKLESLGINWYTYKKSLTNKKINDNNKYAIKREILKLFNDYLKTCQNIEDVNNDFTRVLTK